MSCCGTLGGIPADDCCGGMQGAGALSFSFVPLIIPAANIVAGWDARQLSASPVALWPDASGNGFDLTQAVGASQPTWGAATGPNGQPAVLFDGVDDVIDNAVLSLPAPGTTPSFFWGVMRLVTWVSGRALLTSAGAFRLFEGGLTPQVFPFNGAFGTSMSMTLNVYGRTETYFSNSVADYTKFKTASATGATYGNSGPTLGFSIGSFNVDFGNVQVCEFWIFNTLPSAAQLAALDAYAAARYGAGVLT